MGSIHCENNSSMVDRIQGDIDGSTLSEAETTESFNKNSPSDLEAAKNSDSEHMNPVTSPQLPKLKLALIWMDTILLL